MNCDKTLELLSAELDGRLSEAEHAELQAHLDECADCRRVYGTLRDVDAMLPETQLEPPKALHDAVMREVRADAAKRQQKKRWVPVAVIGAAAIGLLSMGGESGSLLGDALALIGAAFIAGHWLTSRAARRNLPALGFMTFVYGVTAVFLLLISPFAGGLAVTGESIYGIIVLAVVCTLGGHALMTYLLGFVSADVVSFALLAEPIGAAVWALLLFHEKVMPPLMIGGLTVIVGLMLYTYGEMKAGKR